MAEKTTPKTKYGYVPEKCEHCGMTTTYLLGIDRGTVDIVKAIAAAIRNKGINVIHPRKEMEVTNKHLDYERRKALGLMTSNQVGNLSRARFHGLIARVDGNPGNYLLTKKGAKFLRGEAIPRIAIISKAEKHQIGYFQEEEYTCTVNDFRPDTEYWEGINYEVEGGRIIQDVTPPAQQLMGI